MAQHDTGALWHKLKFVGHIQIDSVYYFLSKI